MHFEVIFQLLLCGPGAAITPIVHSLIGNKILPQFDPKDSSIALLEAEIPSLLKTTGKNSGEGFLLVTMVCLLVVFVL